MRHTQFTPAWRARVRALGIITASWLSRARALQSDMIDFDIPAGPLGHTLLEIGRKADRLISFQPALVDRFQAPSIQGRLTLMQALATATRPSGLQVQITRSGAVTVVHAPVVIDKSASVDIISMPAS